MRSQPDDTGQPAKGPRTACLTDIGQVRAVNQDAYGEFTDAKRGYHLLVTADGMGGHRAGEVASQIAVECVGEVFASSSEPPDALLRSALTAANARIFGAAQEDPDLAGMGTTGIALLLTGEAHAWIAHVGDSRAYRLRDGALVQLTDDHSVVGELVKRGQLTAEEARIHPQSNEILRALGTQTDVDVELTRVEIEPGDVYLLCSDGLSGMLPDPEIGRLLGMGQPGDVVHELIEHANEAGGTDNITVQIVEIPALAAARAAASARQAEGRPATEGDAAGDAPQARAAMPWLPIAFALGVVAVLTYVCASSTPA